MVAYNIFFSLCLLELPVEERCESLIAHPSVVVSLNESLASFECAFGYDIILGPAHSICGQNGKWGPTPVCGSKYITTTINMIIKYHKFILHHCTWITLKLPPNVVCKNKIGMHTSHQTIIV